jgi:hypothetical protein
MVGNILGSKVNRLVRRRAYLGGEIVVLESRAQERLAAYQQAEEALNRAREEILALDAEIQVLSTINVADIRPIRATPRRIPDAHGHFVRELIRVLKEANRPVDMAELVPHMATTFSLPFSTRAERARMGEMVRRRLNEYREKGAVERLPSVSERGTGVWRWIGLP